jgi:hypothetical protein
LANWIGAGYSTFALTIMTDVVGLALGALVLLWQRMPHWRQAT